MDVTATDFDAARSYDGEAFSAVEVARTDRTKVVCGYFEPGQFVPVHAPSSDVVVHVRTGTGVVRDGDDEHELEPGDVVVEADVDRGVMADSDSKLEALLVTAPPPTDDEHDPVSQGLANDEFEPRNS